MKAIIISDIHIGNYKTYNPVPDFRLNQFVKLGNLISSVTKEKNVNEIWIAGDLLQTAQSSSKRRQQTLSLRKRCLLSTSQGFTSS